MARKKPTILVNTDRLALRLGKVMSKLLDEQRVKLAGDMEDLEIKFEDKLTKFKSDFFTKIDPILKEVTTAREERPLIASRIKNLEEIHPKGKHLSALD